MVIIWIFFTINRLCISDLRKHNSVHLNYLHPYIRVVLRFSTFTTSIFPDLSRSFFWGCPSPSLSAHFHSVFENVYARLISLCEMVSTSIISCILSLLICSNLNILVIVYKISSWVTLIVAFVFFEHYFVVEFSKK